jgi:hypothetical protein
MFKKNSFGTSVQAIFTQKKSSALFSLAVNAFRSIKISADWWFRTTVSEHNDNFMYHML